ncbi:hypothetical protein K461DRAFT_298415 [Myriangium duriaei CBS 260.36]|uniref:Uncharacterized protein n=1 Tax=Myriangium duriaei CBS 260.36 TaxID=1168546 RepID=A0A9P4ISP4_9PEZI|nr:hypothetical protein K461DRAFT_298415 [Myriangium duriaei CBS 260.36]
MPNLTFISADENEHAPSNSVSSMTPQAARHVHASLFHNCNLLRFLISRAFSNYVYITARSHGIIASDPLSLSSTFDRNPALGMEKAHTFHAPTGSAPSSALSPPSATTSTQNRSRTFSQPRKLHLRTRHGGSTATHETPSSSSSSKTTSAATLLSAALTSPLAAIPDSFRRGGSAAPSRRASLSSTRDQPTSTTNSAAGTGAGLTTISSHPTSLSARLAVYPPQVRLLPSVPVTSSLLATESRLRKAREADVASSLAALSGAALAATQRLDSAYDALLARTAALTSHLSALRDLHSSLSRARDEFTTSAERVQRDATELVENYDVAAREGQVAELVERLGKAKGRRDEAQERLEVLRGRVDGWGKREKEGRGRRRVMASLIGVGAVLVIGLGVWIVLAVGGGRVGETEVKRSIVGVSIDRADWRRGEEEMGKRWKGVLDEL